MTTIQLPDDLAARVRATAAKENSSLEQFVIRTLSAQLDELHRFNEMQVRAARGDKSFFREILDRVPSAPPIPGDELSTQ